LRVEHSRLKPGVPSGVVRKRAHEVHIGLTVPVEVHVGNEAAFKLEEVAVGTELFRILLGESQRLLLVFPTSALFAELSKHFLEIAILNEFENDNFHIAISYRLVRKQPPEIDLHPSGSVDNFFATHDFTQPFFSLNIHPLLTGIFRMPRTGCRDFCRLYTFKLYTQKPSMSIPEKPL